MERILSDVFYNLSSPAAYSAVDKVYKEARKRNSSITRKDVKDFLAKQRTYTLYRDVKRKGKKLKTIPSFLNTDWAADLAVMIKFRKENDENNYLLVCIDMLSRMLYAEPVKTKSPKHVISSFDKIFERANVRPWHLLTDKGLEFNAKECMRYWEKMDIHKYTSENPILHATMAERSIRTIKERLFKYMSEKGTTKWIDVIQDIISAINNSIHTTTGMRPIDVNYKNASDLYEKLYTETQKSKAKFKVGDTVRIEKHKGAFDKGLSKFTDEIFTVAKVLSNHNPVVYRLKDDEGEEIKGIFYSNDLCRASPETSWRIEILKKRVRNGIKEVFVHWIGYRDHYNSWIAESDIV
jgi:hypothetical protein